MFLKIVLGVGVKIFCIKLLGFLLRNFLFFILIKICFFPLKRILYLKSLIERFVLFLFIKLLILLFFLMKILLLFILVLFIFIMKKKKSLLIGWIFLFFLNKNIIKIKKTFVFLQKIFFIIIRLEIDGVLL